MTKTKDIFKRSRTLYVFDGALEYFVSIITAGAYLAKLTETLGISDSLTGILSAFVSLGGALSLLGVFITKKKPIKRKVATLQVICNLSFALLFLTPIFDIKNNIAVLLFCLLFFVGYSLYYIIYTVQSDWFMGLVESGKRGRFSAIVNNFSLVSGMIFSIIMGYIIDYYTENGEEKKFLIVSSVILAVIAILRTTAVLLSREKDYTDDEKREDGLLTHAKALFKNRRFVTLNIIFCLWSATVYATTPFFGTYQNKELGFSMLFVSVLTTLQALSRILGTFVFGRLADKRSFNLVLNLAITIAGAALLLNMFTVPENGKVLFTVYFLMHAVAVGAMSICQVNSVIEVVEPNQRSAAIAIKYSITGFAGFLTTIAVSPLVSYIQRSGNKFLGMNVYAQQVVSAIGVIIAAIAIICFNVLVKKKKEE